MTFGEVQPMRGVGLCSFARFGDQCTLVDLADPVAFALICQGVSTHAAYLKRCVASLGHECARLLSIGRCVYGRCLLNGAVHLSEVDARPLLPCPVELKKLVSTLDDAARSGALPPMDIDARLASRERATLKFLTSHGLKEEAEAARKRVAYFEADEGTTAQVRSRHARAAACRPPPVRRRGRRPLPCAHLLLIYSFRCAHAVAR